MNTFFHNLFLVQNSKQTSCWLSSCKVINVLNPEFQVLDGVLVGGEEDEEAGVDGGADDQVRDVGGRPPPQGQEGNVLHKIEVID